jgi:hypothetical protein
MSRTIQKIIQITLVSSWTIFMASCDSSSVNFSQGDFQSVPPPGENPSDPMASSADGEGTGSGRGSSDATAQDKSSDQSPDGSGTGADGEAVIRIKDLRPTARFATIEKAELSTEIPPESSSSSEGSADADGVKIIAPISQEFASSHLEQRSIAFDLAYGTVQQTLTMKRATSQNTEVFLQKTRSAISAQFQQGTIGSPANETFQQSGAGIVDILVVVDNSGSMSQEQTELSNKLSPLLSEVADKDWRIGVVTTDPNDPCMRDVISKGETDIAERFKKAVQAGVSGTGNEQGVLQSVTGLSCAQNSWVRKDSTIAVLIVSDEDNCSRDGAGCKNTDGTFKAYAKESYLTDYLASIRSVGTDARVYGLIWIPDQVCATGGNKGVQYQRLISQTMGKAGSICDADYSPTLKNISQDVRKILKNNFSLANTPAEGTLQVSVNGTLTTTGYTLQGSTLTFTEPPPTNATISVTYRYNARPIIKEYALSAAVAPGTLKVRVNDVEQTTGFQYNSANQSIQFDPAPAENSQVRIDYLQDTALTTSWTLTGTPKTGSVTATFAGSTQVVTPVVQGSTISFATTPTDGTEITVSYTKLLDPILSYNLAPVTGTPYMLTMKDAVTKADVAHTYDNSTIKIDPAAFVDDRQVIVSYRDDSQTMRYLDLAAIPVEGSVKITLGDAITCQADQFTINDTVATLNCDPMGAAKANVSFQTQVAEKSFELSGVENLDLYKWKVSITDGSEILFERVGSKFSLKSAVPVNSKVTISGMPFNR